jgi:hypothetical protein
MGDTEKREPARIAPPSILELAQRVHRGEITPEEAAQIFARLSASKRPDESA